MGEASAEVRPRTLYNKEARPHIKTARIIGIKVPLTSGAAALVSGLPAPLGGKQLTAAAEQRGGGARRPRPASGVLPRPADHRQGVVHRDPSQRWAARLAIKGCRPTIGQVSNRRRAVGSLKRPSSKHPSTSRRSPSLPCSIWLFAVPANPLGTPAGHQQPRPRRLGSPQWTAARSRPWQTLSAGWNRSRCGALAAAAGAACGCSSRPPATECSSRSYPARACRPPRAMRRPVRVRLARVSTPCRLAARPPLAALAPPPAAAQ